MYFYHSPNLCLPLPKSRVFKHWLPLRSNISNFFVMCAPLSVQIIFMDPVASFARILSVDITLLTIVQCFLSGLKVAMTPIFVFLYVAYIIPCIQWCQQYHLCIDSTPFRHILIRIVSPDKAIKNASYFGSFCFRSATKRIDIIEKCRIITPN